MNAISSFLFNATMNFVHQFIAFINKNSNKYNFVKLYFQLRAKCITQYYIFFLIYQENIIFRKN